MDTEKVFYQDQNVTVTQTRYIALGQTYTMRNISSVGIVKISKSTLLPMILFTIGVVMCFNEKVSLIGVVVAISSFGWMASMITRYTVRISTNSGEVNSLTSKNRKYIQEIVDALNNAIVFRG